MEDTKSLGRREFTVASALAMLSGVVITISSSACGGSDYSSSPTPTPTPAPNPTPTPAAGGDKEGTISGNHGHRARVTGAELSAGAGISLDIRGDATHPHSVQLSSAEIQAIAANQRVSKESSSDEGHSHTVTFN